METDLYRAAQLKSCTSRDENVISNYIKWFKSCPSIESEVERCVFFVRNAICHVEFVNAFSSDSDVKNKRYRLYLKLS